MKITYVANFMNHHQLPFSLKMQELTDGKYTFVAMESLSDERRILGYADMNDLPFVLKAYENKELYRKSIDHILNDDMVIFGTCPDTLLEQRCHTGKPFIIYSERFFKKGTYRRFIPITMKKIRRRMLQFQGKNVSVICSSAYLPYDLSLLHAKFQTYKWGYFPECEQYNLNALLEKKRSNSHISILWVGRLIKLKHPDDSIKIAKRLKEDGYRFELNIVGDGPMRAELEQMVRKYGLQNEVCFRGAKPSDEVRSYMEKANIFLFTSDFHEGWGAVMNESMNSGCAVVASHAVGSAPFLVKNGENGLIYKSGDIKHLYKCVRHLFDCPERIDELGKQAYKTITEQWNSDEAAARLFEIIKAKLSNSCDNLYEDGPCSIATVINPRDTWRKHDSK